MVVQFQANAGAFTAQSVKAGCAVIQSLSALICIGSGWGSLGRKAKMQRLLSLCG